MAGPSLARNISVHRYSYMHSVNDLVRTFPESVTTTVSNIRRKTVDSVV